MEGTLSKGKTVRYLVVLSFLLVALNCAKVNPTAPDGSILYVSANPASIASGGAVSTITVVGYDVKGIPLSDGTAVQFTTDLGSVDEKAFMRAGRAVAALKSDARSGEAHVVAMSGNSKGEVKVLVGFAALSSLTISANPQELPLGGGQSVIAATALDASGIVLSVIPVVFSTSAGSLSSGGDIVLTAQNGEARDVLTTGREATVTATSGDKTASVKVTLKAGARIKALPFPASSALE